MLVAGYDALDDAVAAVRDGTLQVTVDQQPARQGYLGVSYALRILNGEEVPNETMVETFIITRDTLTGG